MHADVLMNLHINLLFVITSLLIHYVCFLDSSKVSPVALWLDNCKYMYVCMSLNHEGFVSTQKYTHLYVPHLSGTCFLFLPGFPPVFLKQSWVSFFCVGKKWSFFSNYFGELFVGTEVALIAADACVSRASILSRASPSLKPSIPLLISLRWSSIALFFPITSA